MGDGPRYLEYQQFESLWRAAKWSRRGALPLFGDEYLDGPLHSLHLPASLAGIAGIGLDITCSTDECCS